MPPIVALTVATATSTTATDVPAALETWMRPAVPIVGGEANVIRSGGSGHWPWAFGRGNRLVTPGGRLTAPPVPPAPPPLPAAPPGASPTTTIRISTALGHGFMRWVLRIYLGGGGWGPPPSPSEPPAMGS